MSEFFTKANDNYYCGKYEEAIINYKDLLKNSKSNDEKYV